MNANECKTCNHYKPVHALNPRGDCTLNPTWLDVPEHHYCGQWAGVAAIDAQKETPALDIDWSEVPEGYDWVAQDEDGYVYGYPDKPTLHESTIDGFWRWEVPECDQHYVEHGQARHSQFSKTLTKRPVGK